MLTFLVIGLKVDWIILRMVLENVCNSDRVEACTTSLNVYLAKRWSCQAQQICG